MWNYRGMSNKLNRIATQFGKNLAAHRSRSGLSQEEVAVGAGLHRTEIGLLERGERLPRIDTVMKLAGALEIELAKLLEGLPPWNPGSMRPGGFD